jgi:hypothetical protein
MAAYMRKRRLQVCGLRRVANWAGIPDAERLKPYAQAEARARGVPVETIIREWRLRG